MPTSNWGKLQQPDQQMKILIFLQRRKPLPSCQISIYYHFHHDATSQSPAKQYSSIIPVDLRWVFLQHEPKPFWKHRFRFADSPKQSPCEAFKHPFIGIASTQSPSFSITFRLCFSVWLPWMAGFLVILGKIFLRKSFAGCPVAVNENCWFWGLQKDWE